MERAPKIRRSHAEEDGEFLWLVSLSDLMILLFVFFVVLFSFSYDKMSSADMIEAVSLFNGDTDTPIDELEDELIAALVNKDVNNQIEIKQDRGVLVLTIKDKLLFDSGGYSLKSRSKDILNAISSEINDIPKEYRVAIEGHTDDAPYKGIGGGVSDNWQLSVLRAHEVFKALNLNDSIKERTVVMGYGPMKPIAANRDELGQPIAINRAKNRRVIVKIY